MNLFASFGLSAMGLAVQRQRMNVISENIANVSTTRTPEGGPYRSKQVVVQSMPLSFEASMESLLGKDDLQGAAVVGVARSNKEPRIVYDPHHPDADAQGNVAMPNVSTTAEMIDMMTATKAYEANVTVFNAAKSMMLRTLDIGGV